jgi:Zn-dependent protease with chaperone function
MNNFLKKFIGTTAVTQGYRGSTWLSIGIAALLSACATSPPSRLPDASSTPESLPQIGAASPRLSPEEEALRQLVALQDRLDRVAAPLLVNNTQLCKGNARHLLGFTAKNRYSYSGEYANAAQKLLSLNERLQVTGVLAGSGAARVGIAPGDGLLAVEDKPLPQGENAERQAAALLAPMVGNRSHVKLGIVRNGGNQTLDVPLTTACAFRIELGNSDAVNSYGDGHRVLVTRGMMQFAQTDQELGLVLAREMAHDILGHAVHRHDAATIASVIDNLIRVHPDLGMVTGLAGIKPYPQEIDAAADNLGIYLAARAGYATADASTFWRRLADKTPTSIANGFTALHPATNYRIAAIDRAASAIRVKQVGHKPLLP